MEMAVRQRSRGAARAASRRRPAPAHSPAALRKRVAQLEAENAALRRRLRAAQRKNAELQEDLRARQDECDRLQFQVEELMRERAERKGVTVQYGE